MHIDRVTHLLIGAGRSGTTTFCKYLQRHPDICFSSLKEVHYFSQTDLFARGNDYYHSFFKHLNDEKVRAAADTYLFVDKSAIERIYKYNPSIKFIVLLRNPVDRSWSSFKYARNYGYQLKEMSVKESLDQEEELLKTKSSIVEINNKAHFYCSLYHFHLLRWLEVFPRDRFFITTSRKLKKDPLGTMNAFAKFAGIAPMNDLGALHLNRNSKARAVWLEQLLLNRESGIRMALRKVIPAALKSMIFDSGVIDKLHKANRVRSVDVEMTSEERVLAEQYFINDLAALAKDFDIVL